METRPLGGTALAVTPICIGGSGIGSMPAVFGYDVPAERGVATARRVLAGPVNFLDTAAGYSEGESERRIGTALRAVGGLPPASCSRPRSTPIRAPATTRANRCTEAPSRASSGWGSTASSSFTCTIPR